MVANDVTLFPSAILLLALVLLSALIAYHDIKHLRIPNVLTFLVATSGFAWAVAVAEREPLSVLSGGVTGLAVLAGIRRAYAVVRKRPGLGLGDVKLAGATCIWTGILQLPSLLLIACLVACIHICVLYVRKQIIIDRSTKLPFGAHMVVALCYVILTGEACHTSNY